MAPGLPIKTAARAILPRSKPVLPRVRKNRPMKALKNILMGFAIVAAMSFTVSAQKKDDKKDPPPKPKPPVVRPEDKRPPRDEKPKKPEYSMGFVAARIEGEIN